jgi:hypothetical protein
MSDDGKLLDFRGRELRPVLPVETKKIHTSGRREGRRVVDFKSPSDKPPLTAREQRGLDEAHAVVLAQTNAGATRDKATIAGFVQIQRRRRLAWAVWWRVLGLLVCTLRGHNRIKIREASTMLGDPTGGSGCSPDKCGEPLEAYGSSERHFVCLRCFEPHVEKEVHRKKRVRP